MVQGRKMHEVKDRKHVRIYLGEDDIREKDGINTLLKAGDELSIIPAIAGGSF